MPEHGPRRRNRYRKPIRHHQIPTGLLGQEIFILNNVSADVAVNTVQDSHQLIGSGSVQCAHAKCIKPFLAGCLHLFSSLLVVHNALNLSL